MTPHKQLFMHDPENGIWGDCHRTAVACLLDLHPSEVPHIYRDGVSRPVAACKAELKRFLVDRFGLQELEIPFPGDCDLADVLNTIESLNPGLMFILGGTSNLGVGHSVIAGSGGILHDPSPRDSGIVGPMEDGFWWVSFLAKATSEDEIHEVLA